MMVVNCKDYELFNLLNEIKRVQGLQEYIPNDYVVPDDILTNI